MYDLTVIGGGPAGIAAGVYAARKQLKTLFIAEEIGGQSSVSLEIQNWIGTPAISGIDFAGALKKHLEAYAGDVVEIKTGERVVSIEEQNGKGFLVKTNGNGNHETKTVLIASGASRRRLEVPGAKEFDQKGVVYCASCDGPLFAGMDTVVIGGGNAGFETAAQLLAYAKSVTLLHRREEFSKADPVTVKKVLSNPKMTALLNSEPVEIKGDQFVTGIVYKNNRTGETKEIPAGGVFVEIGIIPNTDFAKELLELDQVGRIVIDPKNQKTSVEGIWAAGDCTNELYHQNNIAAGDAVKALEDIYVHLHAR